MPKVTVEGESGKRSYEGEFVFASVLGKDRRTKDLVYRWIQDPAGYAGGMGLFLAGLNALREVAEIPGNERFKLAARKAVDAAREFEPKGAE